MPSGKQCQVEAIGVTAQQSGRNSRGRAVRAFTLTAILTVPAVHAQETPSTQSASRGPEIGYVGEEIVVTAQRREQRLSEVPLSVTALSSDRLVQSGVVSSTDLAAVTPGLQYPVSGAFAQPTIRGIGTTVTSAGSDANVALYIDGVYMPSQAGNIFNFNNIERIEVLKGPQGTLYGRNATGGAINITTLAPSFDPQLKASASYGSFNETRLNAYASVPLGEVAAFSIAGLYTDDDGYADDTLRNVDLATYQERAGRAKLLIKPADNLSITFAGDWARKTDLTGYSLKPLDGNTAQAVSISPDARDLALTFTPDFTTESYGGSATVKLAAGDYELSSISSLREVEAHFLTDLDRTQVAASRAEFNTRQHTFTQELNVSSAAWDRFSWVGGIFYYKDRADNFNLRTNGVPGVKGRISTEAIAGYAEGTLEVIDRLSVVGGIRYSTEEREFMASRPVGSPLTLDTQVRYDAWTPRASIRYQLTPAANVYATYSNGFKSGTYNISTFNTVPVEPESVDAYELGFKYYDRGITLNAAGFFYSYTDIQIQAIQVATGLTALTNAARAEIYGFEAEASAPLGSGFEVLAGLAYTHSEYTRFPGALITTPRTSDAVCGLNPNRPCGNTQGPGDASGNAMVRTPELTINLTANYEGALAGGSFRASLTANHNSGYFWDVGNRLEQPSYLQLNGRLSWGPDRGPWRVALWGRNLTNKTYQLYAVDTTQADAVAWARPRSVGVALELAFD